MRKIVLVDASGSMAEEGKKSVARYLLYAIEGLLRDEWSEMPYAIYVVAEEVENFDGKLHLQGQIDAKKLECFLNNERESLIMFLTDSSLSEEVRRTLKKADNRILVVMIGCDCNRAFLKGIAGDGDLYESADVASCVDKFASIA